LLHVVPLKPSHDASVLPWALLNPSANCDGGFRIAPSERTPA